MNGDPPADPQILKAPPTAPPAEVIRQQASTNDYIVLRLAVVGLVVATITALLGGIFLTSIGRNAPDGIVAIGSAGVGALATMLVRPPPQPPPPPIVIDRRGER